MWSIVANNSDGIGRFEITPAFVAPQGAVDFWVQQITAETIQYRSAAFGYPGGSGVQGSVTVDSGTPVQDTTAYPIELLRQAIETSDDWQILTIPPSNRPSTSPPQPHAPTHAKGGDDALTPAAIGAVEFLPDYVVGNAVNEDSLVLNSSNMLMICLLYTSDAADE